MVRAVADAVLEHHGWDRNHFPGLSYGAGDFESNGDHGSRSGGADFDRQRKWAAAVGLVFRCGRTSDRFSGDVPTTIDGVFSARAYSPVLSTLPLGVRRIALLRRRLWNDA